MLQDLKQLPKEMQDVWKTIPNRPDENTPTAIMDFLNSESFIETLRSPFHMNTIVTFANENLLTLDLDVYEKDKNGEYVPIKDISKLNKRKTVYSDFALLVVRKIMWTTDLDTNKYKALDIYDKNEKVFKLKQSDFNIIGDMSTLSPAEKADVIAAFYGIQNDIEYTNLSEWEKRLFVDKVVNRENTNVEKKSPTL